MATQMSPQDAPPTDSRPEGQIHYQGGRSTQCNTVNKKANSRCVPEAGLCACSWLACHKLQIWESTNGGGGLQRQHRSISHHQQRRREREDELELVRLVRTIHKRAPSRVAACGAERGSDSACAGGILSYRRNSMCRVDFVAGKWSRSREILRALARQLSGCTMAFVIVISFVHQASGAEV